MQIQFEKPRDLPECFADLHATPEALLAADIGACDHGDRYAKLQQQVPSPYAAYIRSYSTQPRLERAGIQYIMPPKSSKSQAEHFEAPGEAAEVFEVLHSVFNGHNYCESLSDDIQSGYSLQTVSLLDLHLD